MASMASAPDTGRDSWNRPFGSQRQHTRRDGQRRVRVIQVAHSDVGHLGLPALPFLQQRGLPGRNQLQNDGSRPAPGRLRRTPLRGWKVWLSYAVHHAGACHRHDPRAMPSDSAMSVTSTAARGRREKRFQPDADERRQISARDRGLIREARDTLPAVSDRRRVPPAPSMMLLHLGRRLHAVGFGIHRQGAFHIAAGLEHFRDVHARRNVGRIELDRFPVMLQRLFGLSLPDLDVRQIAEQEPAFRGRGDRQLVRMARFIQPPGLRRLRAAATLSWAARARSTSTRRARSESEGSARSAASNDCQRFWIAGERKQRLAAAHQRRHVARSILQHAVEMISACG